jgi:hypothetical protein
MNLKILLTTDCHSFSFSHAVRNDVLVLVHQIQFFHSITFYEFLKIIFPIFCLVFGCVFCPILSVCLYSQLFVSWFILYSLCVNIICI